MLLIEPPCPLRNRVHQNGADASDIRSLQGAQYGITQKSWPDLFPLIVLMDGQPADDHDWHRIWHVAPNTTWRMHVCYGTHSKGMIADHVLSSADQIGARERELTGKETETWEIIYFKLYQSQMPVIERAIETAALMLGSDRSRGYCLEMICADFLAGANLGHGDPEMLLFSMTRFFKFLPEEQRQAFLRGLSEKAS